MSAKAITRAEKLLRLAADRSTTDAERASAAVEVARIITEYRLRLTAPPRQIATGKWRKSIATREDRCARCLKRIAIGEKIYAKSVVFGYQYAHLSCVTDK